MFFFSFVEMSSRTESEYITRGLAQINVIVQNNCAQFMLIVKNTCIMLVNARVFLPGISRSEEAERNCDIIYKRENEDKIFVLTIIN